jgi:hypothetical protein
MSDLANSQTATLSMDDFHRPKPDTAERPSQSVKKRKMFPCHRPKMKRSPKKHLHDVIYKEP